MTRCACAHIDLYTIHTRRMLYILTYVYVHVFLVHTYMYVYIHIYIHMGTCVCTYTHICTFLIGMPTAAPLFRRRPLKAEFRDSSGEALFEPHTLFRVCLSSIYLHVCLSVCFFYASIYPLIYPSIYLSINLSLLKALGGNQIVVEYGLLRTYKYVR